VRDISTDSDCRIVGTREDLLALGGVRDFEIEGSLTLVIIPPAVAAGTPEQITAFVAAATKGA